MKERKTKKWIKSNYATYSVGNGDIQSLLTFVNASYYSTRIEGWACDYFIFDNVALSSGYDTTGKKINYKLCRSYEEKARKFLEKTRYSKSYKYQKSILNRWINQFLDEITK